MSEGTILTCLLAGHISGHRVPLIYCLFKKIEYLDTTPTEFLVETGQVSRAASELLCLLTMHVSFQTLDGLLIKAHETTLRTIQIGD